MQAKDRQAKKANTSRDLSAHSQTDKEAHRSFSQTHQRQPHYTLIVVALWLTDRLTAGRQEGGRNGRTEAAEASVEGAVCVLFVCPSLGRACLLSAALLSPKTVSHTHTRGMCVCQCGAAVYNYTHAHVCVCVFWSVYRVLCNQHTAIKLKVKVTETNFVRAAPRPPLAYIPTLPCAFPFFLSLCLSHSLSAAVSTKLQA